jgi:hypothetical protein
MSKKVTTTVKNFKKCCRFKFGSRFVNHIIIHLDSSTVTLHPHSFFLSSAVFPSRRNVNGALALILRTAIFSKRTGARLGRVFLLMSIFCSRKQFVTTTVHKDSVSGNAIGKLCSCSNSLLKCIIVVNEEGSLRR